MFHSACLLVRVRTRQCVISEGSGKRKPILLQGVSGVGVKKKKNTKKKKQRARDKMPAW